MRLIAQKDELGCGVACVAAILNIPYEEAKGLFSSREEQAKTRGFCCKDVSKALRRAGKEYEYRYIGQKVKKKIYQPNSIVFIKRSDKYPSGHYLARAKNKWMDPWINYKKRSNYLSCKIRISKTPSRYTNICFIGKIR